MTRLYELRGYHDNEPVFVNPVFVSHVGRYLIDYKTGETATGVWVSNFPAPIVVRGDLQMVITVFNREATK